MSSVPVNTGSLSKLLWPGVNKIFGEVYPQYKDRWPEIFKKYTTDRNWVEDVSMSGFGLLSVKGEGAPIAMDTMRQGFTARYIPSVVAGGFMITREAVDDLQYPIEINKKARALAKAEKQTRETFGANVLNRAFNSSYTGADGLELCSTAHVNAAGGGTYANEMSTPAQMSEAALEDMCTNIWGLLDDRGLKAALTARKLVIPQNLIWETERILTSVKRVGTANNDPNLLKDMGKIPEGWVDNPWLTSTTAFFILTDAEDGLKYFERDGVEFKADNDFDTETAKFKVRARYVFGWSDPRGIYGNTGV